MGQNDGGKGKLVGGEVKEWEEREEEGGGGWERERGERREERGERKEKIKIK